MRRYLAAVAVAAMAAVGVSALASAAPAGAQALSCTFIISPGLALDAPGNVSVSGTAPGTTQVTVLVNGTAVQTVTSNAVTGAWGPVQVFIAASSQVSVSIAPAYAQTPCIGNGGTEVVQVQVGGQSASLPRTGSSDTVPYATAGVALVGVGLVFVVAARRRRSVHRSA